MFNIFKISVPDSALIEVHVYIYGIWKILIQNDIQYNSIQWI